MLPFLHKHAASQHSSTPGTPSSATRVHAAFSCLYKRTQRTRTPTNITQVYVCASLHKQWSRLSLSAYLATLLLRVRLRER